MWADVIAAGDDLIVYIGGGDLSHIGSVSLSEKGEGKHAISLALPRHKDYLISSAAAQKIAEATNHRCMVIAGIHVDNASNSEIRTLIQNSAECVERIIEKIRMSQRQRV